MKIYVGSVIARCRHCHGADWRLVGDARSFNLDSELVCADCGTRETYADLVLQTPLEEPTAHR